MRPDEEQEYSRFVSSRMPALRRFVYLCCGDWDLADDAVQTALLKLYVSWRRVQRVNSLDGYVRRMAVNALNDVRRRLWFRRERSAWTLPDSAAPEAGHAERLTVMHALAKLPPRRRAAVVLRYWEDRSVEQTAQILGCRATTVKTQTAKGLATLRSLLSEPAESLEGSIR